MVISAKASESIMYDEETLESPELSKANNPSPPLWPQNAAKNPFSIVVSGSTGANIGGGVLLVMLEDEANSSWPKDPGFIRDISWEAAKGQRGELPVVLKRLESVAATVDFSRRGNPRETAEHRAQIMSELSCVRRRATTHRLRGQ